MTASRRAAEETERWIDIAAACREIRSHGVVPAPRELACTGFDPHTDLAQRCRRWGHHMSDAGLAELARFAAGLAQIESESWEVGDAVTATRAFEERRFLLGDRIVHWAVPWADEVDRSHESLSLPASSIRDSLLDLADRMRVAPLLTGAEGLFPPGEDSIGPTSSPTPRRIGMLASGAVLTSKTMRSLTEGAVRDAGPGIELLSPEHRSRLATHYRASAYHWMSMSHDRPGSARLWRDLSVRASATARWLESSASLITSEVGGVVENGEWH